ncbi:hypothetical protein B7435_25990 [Mycolicibacterium peregrinum]|nr:hypothetical protein B7435_25990 [Mycolicibacterium peregrinum]
MPSRSEIEGWTVNHLEAAATDSSALHTSWNTHSRNSFDAFYRADWLGDAREDAYEQFRSVKSHGEETGDLAQQLSTMCTSAAGEISTAKQMAVREITDAEAAGFTVGEDLSVTYDSTGLSEAEAATKAADAAKHAGWIHSAALNLITADTDHARSIASTATTLGSMKRSMSLGEPRGTRSPSIQATSFDPKLSPTETPRNGSGNTRGQREEPPKDGSQSEPRQERAQREGQKPDGKPEKEGEPTAKHDDPPKDDEHKSSTAPGENTSNPASEHVTHDDPPSVGTPTPMPSQQGGVPMSPPSGLGGGGAPKMPSAPSMPMGSPGGAGATPVQPAAAFDKPLQAAAGSLGNNVPAAGGFAPTTQPTAAPTNAAGPVAPITPPPATQAPATATPAPGPAPAAATPPAGPTHTGAPVAGGGMMPPMLASGGAGGVGGSPAAPMTSATPPAVPPVAPPASTPAAVGATAGIVPPSALDRADKARRNSLDQTGNKEGRIAHNMATLCAHLHAATRAQEDKVQWVVAARKSDGLLVVANNIGAGWLPASVALPRRDSRGVASAHVFVHGDMPWEVRQDWFGSPVRAVKQWSRMDGEPVGMIACMQATADAHAAEMASFNEEHDVFIVNDAEVPPTVPIMSGFDRFTVIAGLEEADKVEKEKATKTALVSRLPSAASTFDAGEQPSMALLFSDIISVNEDPAMMVENRISVWRTFCSAQATMYEELLRGAEDDAAARGFYRDYAYFAWNLEQLGQPAEVP